MKDYCVSCERKKEGLIDDETGWFRCFKCAEQSENAIRNDLQRDYDWFNSLNDEQQSEVRSEYALAGVRDFP